MNYVQISETQRQSRSYSVQVDSKTDFKTKNKTMNWQKKYTSRKMNKKMVMKSKSVWPAYKSHSIHVAMQNKKPVTVCQI